MATGAVLVGRRTFDIAGRWSGDHHDGVPIFVPTRGEPPEPASDRVHYVTDGVESAMAPGEGRRRATPTSSSTAPRWRSRCLRAGVLDELEIHLIPVLLGEGRRLFDGASASRSSSPA